MFLKDYKAMGGKPVTRVVLTKFSHAAQEIDGKMMTVYTVSIMDLEEKHKELRKLANQIKVCTKCDLCKNRLNAVPGEGNPNSELVFIGEGPGFHEDQQGSPFVGRAGKLLEFMLSQIGKKREDVWIGNVIKCRPPNNRDPLPSEVKACDPYLTKQLEILAPKLVVTLGRFAMNYFLPNAKISQAHGKSQRLSRFMIYPLYHPAAGLRNTNIKKVLIEDFLKIPEILKMDPEKDEIIEISNKIQIKQNVKEKQVKLF